MKLVGANIHRRPRPAPRARPFLVPKDLVSRHLRVRRLRVLEEAPPYRIVPCRDSVNIPLGKVGEVVQSDESENKNEAWIEKDAG